MKLPEEMKDLAHVIIERKAGHFDAAEFNDRYEDAVVELIRSKQEGLPARARRAAAADQCREYHGRASQEHRGRWRRRACAEKSDAKPPEVASTPKPKAASKTRSATEPAQAQPKAPSVSTANEGKKDQVTSEEQGREDRRPLFGATDMRHDFGLSASDRKHGSRPSGGLRAAHAPPPRAKPNGRRADGGGRHEALTL